MRWLLILLLTGSCFAQTTRPTDESQQFKYIPPEEWRGHKFLLMPRPAIPIAGFRHTAHGHYPISNGAVMLRYEQGVNKIARVESVQTIVNRYEIQLKIGSDDCIARMAAEESLPSLMLERDLKVAQNLWQQKDVWLKCRRVLAWNRKDDSLKEISIAPGTSAKIKRVVAGWDENKPIRLFFNLGNKEEAFVDVNVSGTNVTEDMREKNRPDDLLFFEDPKPTRNWSTEEWKKMQDGDLWVGMNEEQFVLAVGDVPKEETREEDGHRITHYFKPESRERYTFVDGRLSYANYLQGDVWKTVGSPET